MQEICHCPYNEKTRRCVLGDCQDYVEEHKEKCNHKCCELCTTIYDGKYDTSLFDRHTQDCFFNGCTTEAHK